MDYLEPFCALSKVPMFLMQDHIQYFLRIGLRAINLLIFAESTLNMSDISTITWFSIVKVINGIAKKCN